MKSTRLLHPYFYENRIQIFSGLLFLILVDLLQLYIPRLIKLAVDDLTYFRIDIKGLLLYAFYIVLIAIFIGFFRYGWRRCLIGTSRRIEEGLRNRLFRHIHTLSPSYFDETRTGDLMAHGTNDIQHIRMATGMGIVALTDALVLGTAAIAFMAYINVKLTLFVAIPMPLIAFGARVFSRKMHRNYKNVQAAFSDITEAVREKFSGIRVIKAYNREPYASRQVDTLSKKLLRRNMALVKITGLFFPMMILFSNLSLAVVLFLGGRQTICADISPGEFVAFISYLGLLTWPMMAIGWVINLIQRGRASLDRINTILQTEPEIYDHPDAMTDAGLSAGIEFAGVSFGYASYQKPVLKGIDFNMQAGDVLGIVGPPGSGKTTLLNLIPRFFEVQQGCIRIGGTDIGKIRLDRLRHMIAYLSQEPFLFNGTVRDNILLWSRDKPAGEMTDAAKAAAAYETIMGFPAGFDTLVGEKGVILSGGQKQRIALARCFLQDTPILLLDDPISQVDTETGAAIIANLQSMLGTKTMVITSHRMAVLRLASHIIVLDKGRVIESGHHDALMNQDGYYARTYRLQALEEEFNAGMAPGRRSP